MVLLSSMMRSAAITGSTDYSFFTRIAGRQGGRWAERTVGAAFPTARSEKLRELAELRERGIITDGELERLRSRLRV